MSIKKWLSVFNTFVLRGLGSGVAVIFTLSVARYVETNSAAQFFLFFNICTIAAVCFRWGLDEVIIRKTASAEQADVGHLSRNLIRSSHLRVAAWAAPASALALLLFIPKLSEYFNNLTPTDFFLLIITSSLTALTACAARIQQGRGRINTAAILLNIITPSITLSGLFFLVLISFPVDATTLIMLYACTSAGVYLFTVSKNYGNPAKILTASKSTNSPDHLIPSKIDNAAANKLGGVVLAQQALTWSSLLIIPFSYSNTIYAGFVVAQKLSMLTSLVMLAINFTFSSRFAYLHAAGKVVELRRTIKLSAAIIVSSSIIASALMILIQDHIFDFANIEEPMGSVLVQLLVAQSLFSIASLYSVVLSMCHDENFLLWAQASINTCGVIMLLIFSRVFPIETTCLAFILCNLSLFLVLAFRSNRILSS